MIVKPASGAEPVKIHTLVEECENQQDRYGKFPKEFFKEGPDNIKLLFGRQGPTNSKNSRGGMPVRCVGEQPGKILKENRRKQGIGPNKEIEKGKGDQKEKP